MSRKNSNKWLILVLAALAVVVFFMFYSDLGNTKKTFRSELVSIDTAAVTKIVITPKTKTHGKVELMKLDGKWWVKLSETKSAQVPQNKIDVVFKQFGVVIPHRLASRTQAKWNEYQVSEQFGTRLEVFEDDDKTLDIMLGKLTFKGQRSIASYVRLFEEDDVYEVDGLMAPSFDAGRDTYRDKSIIAGAYKNWTKVDLVTPDESFALLKVGENWSMGKTKVDSAETDRWLRQAASVSGSNFVDDPDQALVAKPTHILTVDTDTERVVVNGYKTENAFLISSSKNPGVFFDGNANKLAEKFFPEKKKLTK